MNDFTPTQQDLDDMFADEMAALDMEAEDDCPEFGSIEQDTDDSWDAFNAGGFSR